VPGADAAPEAVQAPALVIDASIVVLALTSDTPSGQVARDLLRGRRPFAPALVDVEVLTALRRLVIAGAVPSAVADRAAADLARMPLRRVPHGALLPRCWELRDDLTLYDAVYVALAEALDAVLVTADAGLAAVPGLRCRVELVLDRPPASTHPVARG
jgi:predicted nucleic acid-binding protein